MAVTVRSARCLILGFIQLGLVACAPDPATQARELLEIDDLTRAQAVLEPAVDADPRNLELRLLLLDVHERAEDWDQAVQTAQVVARLDSSTVSQFRLMHARARGGDFTRLREQLDAYPRPTVDQRFADALLERGLPALPNDSAEHRLETIRRAKREQPGIYLQVARDLGVIYHRAASILAGVDEGITEDNYRVAYNVGQDLSDLRTMAPHLVAGILPAIESLLSSVPEPERPRSIGMPGLDDISWRLYWRQMVRYYEAIGELEAAIDPMGEGAQRAITAFRSATDARDLSFRADAVRTAPGSPRLRMLEVLAEAGSDGVLELECRELRLRFASWYERFPQEACEEIFR